MPARTPRTIHLASATLASSSAYSSQAAYRLLDGFTRVTFYVTYTRSAGIAACRPKFKILVGNGTDEGQIAAIDPTIDSSSAPLGRQSLYLGEILGPVPSSDAAITFPIQVELRGGETTVRLLAAEHGASGTPGTCAIALTSGK